MRNTGLYLLLLTLCCACSREPLDGEFIDMSGYDVPCIEAVEVKHRVTEEECYGIFDVRTAEGKVIITKEFSDNLIHVIDPESGAVAATVLHLGRGPGEAVNSYYIGMSEDRSRFWAKDLALNQINIFDTRSVLQGSRQPLRTVRLNRYSGTEMDIMPVGDSIYTCSQLGGTVMRFNVYDSTGTYIRSFGTFPRLRGTAGLKDYARPSVFGGHAVYMEDCSRFAVANDCISLISIYSPEGTIISNAWGPEEVLPMYEVKEGGSTGTGGVSISGGSVGWDEEQIPAYYCLRSYGGKLYALFGGTAGKEGSGSTVVVTDSNGIPQMYIRLDRTLIRFDIDPERGTIWGVDSDNTLRQYRI